METVGPVLGEGAVASKVGTLSRTTFFEFYDAMPSLIQARFRAAMYVADDRLKRVNYPGTMVTAVFKTATVGKAPERHLLPIMPIVFVNVLRRFLPPQKPGVYSGHWSTLPFQDVLAYWQKIVEPFEPMALGGITGEELQLA